MSKPSGYLQLQEEILPESLRPMRFFFSRLQLLILQALFHSEETVMGGILQINWTIGQPN